jgi:hypothetical protein
MGPRAGLEDVEKRKSLTLPGLELQPLDRPARHQSLYRLRYPGSYLTQGTDTNAKQIKMGQVFCIVPRFIE